MTWSPLFPSSLKTNWNSLMVCFLVASRRKLSELARFAAANLTGTECANAVSACSDLSDFPGTRLDSLPHWLGFADMLLTRGGKRRTSPTKNEGFPATDEGREAKDRLTAIELDEQVLARLHTLRSLPPVRFEARQWDVLDALLVLLPVTVAQLRLVFREAKRVDFTEIAIGAREAMGSDAEPTDLACTGLQDRAPACRRVPGYVPESVRASDANRSGMAAGRRSDSLSRRRPHAVDLWFP